MLNSFLADESSDEEGAASTPATSPRPSVNGPRFEQLALQKDKVIESLRLELAEAQHRHTEVSKMSEQKLKDAREQLQELRTTNIRLMEENESFQLLLGQAT